MTLWSRVSGGVYLCGAVGVAVIVATLLSRSDAEVLQVIGGTFGAIVYMFGLIAFAVGLAIVVVGTIGHLRSNLSKRPPHA